MFSCKPITIYNILLLISVFVGILVFVSSIVATVYGLCYLHLTINNFESKKAVLTKITKSEEYLPLYCIDDNIYNIDATIYSSKTCYCKTHVICKLSFDDIFITVHEYYNLSPISKHSCPSQRSIYNSCSYSLYSSMLIFNDKNLNTWSFSDNSFTFTIYSILIILFLIIFLIFLFLFFYSIFLCINYIFNSSKLNPPSNISFNSIIPNVSINHHLPSL